MIEEIKMLLGDRAGNYTDAQINLAYKMACMEIEEYCHRELDSTLELIAEQVAVIKLNMQGSEGIASQSFSGASETFVQGYPLEIQRVLNRKRKLKVL